MAKDPTILWAESILEDWVEQSTNKYSPSILKGEGGFSKVFLGTDNLVKGRQVALKICRHTNDEYVRTLFEKERDFLAKKNHPHLIQLLDYRVCNGHPVLVIEQADHNLEDVLTTPGFKFSLDQIIGIIEQAGSGLSYIHSFVDDDKPLTHRDIKPSNILIMDSENKVIKVSDLGCVGFSGISTTMHGTSVYRALEGFRTPPEFFPESDIYSLAILVYALFAKTTPYADARTDKELSRLKKQKTFVRIKCKELNLPDDVIDVLAKATMPDYNERFHSVNEFVGALKSTSSNFAVNGRTQARVAEQQFQGLYENLIEALSGGYGKYGLTGFEDIDEIYTAHDHFQVHARSHNLKGTGLYEKGSEAYQKRRSHDRDICCRLLEEMEAEIKEKNRINEDQLYHIAELIHLWGPPIADERVSMVQINDGSFYKHYKANMPKNDHNLKKG